MANRQWLKDLALQMPDDEWAVQPYQTMQQRRKAQRPARPSSPENDLEGEAGGVLDAQLGQLADQHVAAHAVRVRGGRRHEPHLQVRLLPACAQSIGAAMAAQRRG